MARRIRASAVCVLSLALPACGAPPLKCDGWIPAFFPGTPRLRDVAWGPPGFVAVGDGGIVLTSRDGLSWTQRATGTSAALWGVAWNGRLYAAASDDLVLRSSDGVAWDPQPAPLPTFHDLRAADGAFLALAGDARTYAFTSAGGARWEERGIAGGALRDAASNGSRLVAVGFFCSGSRCLPTGAIMTAEQRAGDWIPVSSREIASTGQLTAVAWGPPGFVAVGSGGSRTDLPVRGRSLDGLTWTPIPNPPGRSVGFIDVVWTGRRYVALGGESGGIFSIATSTDGLSWSEDPVPRAAGLSSVAANDAGSLEVAVGAGTILVNQCTSEQPTRTISFVPVPLPTESPDPVPPFQGHYALEIPICSRGTSARAEVAAMPTADGASLLMSSGASSVDIVVRRLPMARPTVSLRGSVIGLPVEGGGLLETQFGPSTSSSGVPGIGSVTTSPDGRAELRNVSVSGRQQVGNDGCTGVFTLSLIPR